jgi:predicted molibdopterin-dependent oxidoreductase YjgC
LASAQRPFFLYGSEAATGPAGQAAVAALANLAALLGQAERVGYVPDDANDQGLRDVGCLPGWLPGQSPVGEAATRERLGRLWGTPPPVEAGLTYDQMLNGGLKALYVVGDDPAQHRAHSEALKQLEFLVVQDLFLTATAQIADVVLPATSFAEADGTYTNLERRVQRARQGIRPVGESRPDWAIVSALAERWIAAQVPASVTPLADGEPEWKRKKRRKAGAVGVRQPALKPWNYPTAAVVLDEIARAVPMYADLRWDNLGTAGVQWPVSAMPRGGRRIEPVQTAGLPPSGGRDLWLASAALLWDGSTLMQRAHEQVRRLAPQPFVAVNPADLTRNGLVTGALVSVTSPAGSVQLPLRVEESVQPGTAWIPRGLAGQPAEILGAGRGEMVCISLTVS